MDTQLVEHLGRQHLIGQLLRAGLEVAVPIRDRGIDVIAYVDVDRRVEKFVACPIQLKVASQRTFCLDAKYERVRNLLIAYVWNVEGDSAPTIYALDYREAKALATKVGWTKTVSWKQGRYTTTRPSRRIVELLERYRMTPERWWERVAAGAF
jgi:hypothetical protein